MPQVLHAPLERPCDLCGALRGFQLETGWVCGSCGWQVGRYVDHELPPPQIHVVYYLRLDERVKIGTTFRPRQRIAALPHDEVLAFERGDRVLEQQRHAEFAADRLGSSEWFSLTRRLSRHIQRIADGRDAWETHARWLSTEYSRR